MLREWRRIKNEIILCSCEGRRVDLTAYLTYFVFWPTGSESRVPRTQMTTRENVDQMLGAAVESEYLQGPKSSAPQGQPVLGPTPPSSTPLPSTNQSGSGT